MNGHFRLSDRMLRSWNQQQYVLWNAVSVPLLHVTLCYVMRSVTAYRLVTATTGQPQKKLFFKLLAMHTHNILAASKLSRNVL